MPNLNVLIRCEPWFWALPGYKPISWVTSIGAEILKSKENYLQLAIVQCRTIAM